MAADDGLAAIAMKHLSWFDAFAWSLVALVVGYAVAVIVACVAA